MTQIGDGGQLPDILLQKNCRGTPDEEFPEIETLQVDLPQQKDCGIFPNPFSSPTDLNKPSCILMNEVSAEDSAPAPEKQTGLPEDIIAIFAGISLLLLCLLATWFLGENTDEGFTNPLSAWVNKPSGWGQNPLVAFTGTVEAPKSIWLGILGAFVLLGGFFTVLAPRLRPKASPVDFAIGYVFVFLLAVVAYVLAGQSVIKSYSLSYALWALIVGAIIGNTIGKKAFGSWGEAAIRTELYIKTGLVVFGAEVLFGKLLNLGLPGILISWVVTPIVLITTFWFGQAILKMRSATLNMVISADMSVCGVSAAIATAAACRAKKEELSVAIGLSLCFTAVMMVVMPMIVAATGMGPMIGGAWIGGTIDATGAVAAAGGALGDDGLLIATTIKMIQNILIGVIAFGVAAYWTTRGDSTGGADRSINLGEIWKRFPKFVLGFFIASIVFSLLSELSPESATIAKETISVTKTFRGWLFCLAFVCIGIELNFKELAGQLSGGKPLVLYLCGQTLNLILTLTMAILVFKFLFPELASDVTSE